MRKLLLVILALTFFSACTVVEPGYKAVKVHLHGNDKGDAEVLSNGRYWTFLNWNVRFHHFPVFEQNYVFTSDKREGSPVDESFTFQSNDGAKITVNAGLAYTIENVKTVFYRYRRGVDEITSEFLRNMIRDGFNRHGAQYGIEELYSEGKNELLKKVFDDVKAEAAEVGIDINRLYLIGNLGFPPQIEKAIANKLEADQEATQRELELRKAEAQAEIDRTKAQGKADARVIEAEGIAEANRKVARSLTPLLVEYEAMDRWDGKVPYVNSGAVPFIDLKNN